MVVVVRGLAGGLEVVRGDARCQGCISESGEAEGWGGDWTAAAAGLGRDLEASSSSLMSSMTEGADETQGLSVEGGGRRTHG